MNPYRTVQVPRWMESTLLQSILRSRWRALGTALLGAGLGALYAHLIGCRTGTCPITSNVWAAALYAGALGAAVGWPGDPR